MVDFNNTLVLVPIIIILTQNVILISQTIVIAKVTHPLIPIQVLVSSLFFGTFSVWYSLVKQKIR